MVTHGQHEVSKSAFPGQKHSEQLGIIFNKSYMCQGSGGINPSAHPHRNQIRHEQNSLRTTGAFHLTEIQTHYRADEVLKPIP